MSIPPNKPSVQSEMEEGTTFRQLMKPIEAGLEKIEKRRPIHHLETFSFTAFVTLLVYYFTKGIGSGRLLLTDTLSAAKSLNLPLVPRSTFFETFNRFPVKWFAELLMILLSTIAWKEIPELQSLGKLYCVDGSLFPALATMLWAEYQRSCNALKLHLVFDLNRMVPVQILVGSGNSNEKSALKQMLEAGVTYIADRGYVSFPLLADIVLADAFFVFRMKSNLSYTLVEHLEACMPESVSHIFTQVTDQKISLNNAPGKPSYRLIVFWILQDQFLILSNRMDLSTFQIILIYGYRWQVELMFRFLKRSLNGLHLLSTSQQGVTIQFYVLLIVSLLQLHLKQSCVAACQPTPAKTLSLPPSLPDDSLIAERMVTTAQGSPFLATVGADLQRYWKIGLHWLTTLRNLLAQPFNPETIHLLGHT